MQNVISARAAAHGKIAHLYAVLLGAADGQMIELVIATASTGASGSAEHCAYDESYTFLSANPELSTMSSICVSSANENIGYLSANTELAQANQYVAVMASNDSAFFAANPELSMVYQFAAGY